MATYKVLIILQLSERERSNDPRPRIVLKWIKGSQQVKEKKKPSKPSRTQLYFAEELQSSIQKETNRGKSRPTMDGIFAPDPMAWSFSIVEWEAVTIWTGSEERERERERRAQESKGARNLLWESVVGLLTYYAVNAYSGGLEARARSWNPEESETACARRPAIVLQLVAAE
jgi:hypothetical protein